MKSSEAFKKKKSVPNRWNCYVQHPDPGSLENQVALFHNTNMQCCCKTSMEAGAGQCFFHTPRYIAGLWTHPPLLLRLANGLSTTVARRFVFKPKIQTWVNFGGSCTGRCWYILWTLGPLYSLLLYFMDFWCSSWYIFPVLVFCAKRNMATVLSTTTPGHESKFC
jgi:hypothetical protein